MGPEAGIGLDTGDNDASALDLLAQASQLEVAQATTPDNEEGEDELEPEFEIKSEEGVDLHDATFPDHSHTRQSSHGSALEPPIDLRPIPSQPQSQSEVNVKTPLNRPRKLSEVHTPSHAHLNESPRYQNPPATEPPAAHSHTHSHGLGPGAFASPTGGTVPGLGKYVHLSSSMPARRVRSPYLKWTVEEVGHCFTFSCLSFSVARGITFLKETR